MKRATFLIKWEIYRNVAPKKNKKTKGEFALTWKLPSAKIAPTLHQMAWEKKHPIYRRSSIQFIMAPTEEGLFGHCNDLLRDTSMWVPRQCMTRLFTFPCGGVTLFQIGKHVMLWWRCPYCIFMHSHFITNGF